jgi:ankyrin repeat protein
MTGNTAAHFASTYGYDDVYALLVERGADLTLRNTEGATPPEWTKAGKAPTAGAP